MQSTFDTVHAVYGESFDAILFDLDGTLIDSTGATERAWLRWAEEEGLGGIYRHKGHGKPAAAIVAEHVPAERVDAALARAAALELQETAGIVIKPGVARLLAQLPEESWAIVTSCTRELAAVRMAAAGLHGPRIMVTFDDVTVGKPSPEGFMQAAAKLAVTPERCLVVEDAPAGLLAGRGAGCATLALAGTFDAADLTADQVLASLEELSVIATGAGLVPARSATSLD